MSNITEVKNRFLTQESFCVYSCCMYRATWENFCERANSLVNDPTAHIFGYLDHDRILGLIAVRQSSLQKAEIKGIAVESNSRSNGIGRALIEFVLTKLPVAELYAETDDDAVGFYRKCGFETEEVVVESPAGNYRRYRCRLNRT